MSAVSRTPDANYRWSVASRAVAAIVGGYAVTSLLTLVFSVLLPFVGVNQAEAVLATTMASFLVYAAIVMAVFHARSAIRAWIWLGGSAVLVGLVVWLLLPATNA